MRTGFVILVALLASTNAIGGNRAARQLEEFNAGLAGQVVDHTQNHGADRRIYSPILHMKRDLYVYLPPCYDPARKYPVVLWLHGAFGDEHAFLDTASIPVLDRMIACGCCPPVIVACPDGTYDGKNKLTSPHSLYVNGCGGPYEEHILHEVLPYVECRYHGLRNRKARAVTGVSAGGIGAMNLALRHRDTFGIVGTISAPLNLRYDNCAHDYFANFSPCTYRWKTQYNPNEVVGKFLCGLFRARVKLFIEPVFGREPGVIERVIPWNPADLLFLTDLKPGELDIYIRYGGEDNLNFDAQMESFLWLAAGRGVTAHVERDPTGDHSLEFFRESNALMWRWLCGRLQTVAPESSLPADR